jgi:Cu+-exporting ATPase
MAPVKDVVCKMMVDTETVEHRLEYEGQVFYFCSAMCKRVFEQSPAAFAPALQPNVRKARRKKPAK